LQKKHKEGKNQRNRINTSTTERIYRKKIHTEPERNETNSGRRSLHKARGTHFCYGRQIKGM